MGKRTRYVLLGLLREESMNGYEIKKAIDIRMSSFWKESFGQIYPELKAMTEEGLLLKKEDEHSELRRDSFAYEITDKGIQVFNDWMNQKCERDSVRSERLLRYLLATDDNKQAILQNLREDIAETEAYLEFLVMAEADLNSKIAIHNNHRYQIEVVRLGIHQAESRLTWAREFYKHLLEGGNDRKVK